jgi:hypothetical protein
VSSIEQLVGKPPLVGIIQFTAIGPRPLGQGDEEEAQESPEESEWQGQEGQQAPKGRHCCYLPEDR